MMQTRTDGPIIEEIPDSPRSRVPHPSRSENNIPGVSQITQDKLERLVRNPELRNDPVLMHRCVNLLRDMRDQRVSYLEENDINTSDDQIINAFNSRIYRYTEQLRKAEDEYYIRKARESQLFEETRRRNTRDFEQVTFENHTNTRLSQNNQSNHIKSRISVNSDDSDDDSGVERSQSLSKSRSVHQSSLMAVNNPKNSQSKTSRVKVVRGKNSVSKSKHRRYRPGQKALQEIRKYQKSTDLLIQRAPFRRLVVEIMREKACSHDFRISGDALNALQEAAEVFLVDMFEKTTLLSHHAKRVTLMAADIQLYRRLCYQ